MACVQYPFAGTYLTPQEARIVSLLRRAYSRTQIAWMLKISERTLNTHVNNILRKLRLHTNAEIIVLAMDEGFDKEGKFQNINLFKGIRLQKIEPGFEPFANYK
jgi:DNA-binding CsgD family transcriptional regulator